MRLSTRSRYGLRLLVELAYGPKTIAEIAANQDISAKYLSKLVIPLKARGLILADRGANGGYRLANEPEATSLLEIVEALEGDLRIVDCEGSACGRSTGCGARRVWEGLEKAMRDYCGSLTLAEVSRIDGTVNYAEYI